MILARRGSDLIQSFFPEGLVSHRSKHRLQNILIIFATTKEARSTIELTGASPVSGATVHVWSEGEVAACYRFEKGLIAICGTGLHPAQMCATKYAPLAEEIWNFGFAGALKKDEHLGHLVEIATNDKYLPIALDKVSYECATSGLPSLQLSPSGHKLISSDFPVHDAERRKQLGLNWDLVDMEGYGIAYAAHFLGKKCRIWKIVSDFASCDGRELIRNHQDALSHTIAHTIKDNLHEYHESCAHP